MDPDIKCLWNSVQTPSDSFELQNIMEKAGLRVFCRETLHSGTPKNSSNENQKKPKSGSKRPYRRIKITNDYLEGIDLSQDMPEAEK